MERQLKPYHSVGLAASAAVLVVNVTHPIDFFKTCRQVDRNFSIKSIKLLIHTEGFFSPYKGIQAAWCRELAYTSFKLGAYGPLRDFIGGKDSFGLKFLAGATTGCFGSILGNPFDLIKTRLMTTVKNDAAAPQGMRGISLDIYRHRGMSGFYRGLRANIGRAVVLNGVKMSTYDTVKGYVQHFFGWGRKDPLCQLVSTFFAGFAMAVCSSPFDFLRTKLMNQPAEKQVYNGVIDASRKIFKLEGPLAFYRGFFMIWIRFVPQATLQLMTFEFFLSFFGFNAI